MAAILSATELKNSREAIDAGINGVTDGVADEAIADAEAFLNRVLGYKVNNSDTTLTLRGAGNEYLFPNAPIRTIGGITENGSAIVSTSYILESGGFVLRRLDGAGWLTDKDVVITGTFGYANTDDRYRLAKRAVLLMAVRQLQGSSSTDELPDAPPGAVLSSVASEGASFFFRPVEPGTVTPYADVDRLVKQLRLDPKLG